MSEGLSIVIVAIVGVFANLLILMAFIAGLGRLLRRKDRPPDGGTNMAGKAVA